MRTILQKCKQPLEGTRLLNYAALIGLVLWASITAAEEHADVIIVGAGISGMCAAVESARSGARVIVIDRNSVPGGHAVLAGGPTLVDTPLQKREGYTDSPAVALEDWMTWTEGTADPYWANFYAKYSRTLVHDWLRAIGVEFVRLIPGNGDSVPRFHFTQNGAIDIVLALFRTLLGMPNVTFLWNSEVVQVRSVDGRVTDLEVAHLRDSKRELWSAQQIVLATGGFEGDLEKVRATWPDRLPEPERLLIGASRHAKGAGHDLARDAGAVLANLDRHFIYINGTPDPRDPTGRRAVTVDNAQSLWVNSHGIRFTNETGDDKRILEDILEQPGGYYWMIFDAQTRSALKTRGAEWLSNPAIDDPLLKEPGVAVRANTLSMLARKTSLRPFQLKETVERYNRAIAEGVDKRFARWHTAASAPPPLASPPYYAVKMFPMTRKSMGGVVVNESAEVVNEEGASIPGLYAVGELTGSVGINGIYGLDGMFLGPAMMTGVIAGRHIAEKYPERQVDTSGLAKLHIGPGSGGHDELDEPRTNTVERLRQRLAESRAGFWHFETSHGLVLEREYSCNQCHSSALPMETRFDRATWRARATTCLVCHN